MLEDLIPTQDPKYSILGGRIVNTVTREPIPMDEPIFMFRARDRHALDALWPYLDGCQNKEHRLAIRKRIDDFFDFAKTHPTRMKEPDSPLIETPR